MNSSPIGIFDSGVGGLSVLQEVRWRLPGEDIIYVADQKRVPYGSRSLEDVQQFTREIVHFLLSRKAKLIVIACNTASAAALYHVRETWPGMPFVGMEPAVRPAARNTQSGIIGVIATEVTFQGRLYASLIDRFAAGVQVVKRACPEFVLMVENYHGNWQPEDDATVKNALAGIQQSGADQLVLGCTHFTFLHPLFEKVLGDSFQIVDPAPAVARQVERVLKSRNLLSTGQQSGHITYYTTGNPLIFRQQIENLILHNQPDVQQLLLPHS